MINIIIKCQNKKNVKTFIVFIFIRHGFWLLWTYLHPFGHKCEWVINLIPWFYNYGHVKHMITYMTRHTNIHVTTHDEHVLIDMAHGL